MQGLGSGLRVLEFRVQGLGFRVLGRGGFRAGLRVQSLGV